MQSAAAEAFGGTYLSEWLAIIKGLQFEACHHNWPLSMCITGATESENTLMKSLFSKYNLKVRPARTPEERVVVRVGMILTSFVGLVRPKTPTQKYTQ